MAKFVHLPNGQVLSVSPVFAGYFFKPSELNVHSSAFPAGWTIILQTEDYAQEQTLGPVNADTEIEEAAEHHRHQIHPFRQPTLCNDYLFISSISNPSSHDFKAPASPTRQIAMMLWASLYWYFHLGPPSLQMSTESSKDTPQSGKPRGEWRINIKREGVFRGRNLLQKLERMGLIACADSSVGLSPDNTDEGWAEIMVTRRMYWALSPRVFLFQLAPKSTSAFPGSPISSRPASPILNADGTRPSHSRGLSEYNTSGTSAGLWSPSSTNPFHSGSYLPTYFPPPPLQYTLTHGVRHPLRPKPPRQGEIFYTRYIPSVRQYLSFRTISISPLPCSNKGPIFSDHCTSNIVAASLAVSSYTNHSPATPCSRLTKIEAQNQLNDVQLLNKWMNIPRVSAAWGEQGPMSHQEDFIKKMLTNKNSFPAIGMWDGQAFGYFEIYWAKEDSVGQILGDRINDFDQGIHVLVGEDEFRGAHRVMCWLSSLVHWVFLHDNRTMNVVMEPRVDNERFIGHLMSAGFSKDGEVSFPHKQSAFMRLRRENFEAPVL